MHRVPRSRERVRRRRCSRRLADAARPHLRRDPGPRAGDRRVGAGRPTAPWEYYVAHGRGPAVRDPLPPAARRRRDDEQVAARRERARRRATTTSRSAASRSRPTTGCSRTPIDVNGGERYTLRFRDLDTGADLADVVENVTYGLAWADDARTCFYVRPDDAMRPNEVWRHALGTPDRRRRARVPRRRRALLRRRRPHPHGPVRAHRRRRRS